MSVVAAAPPLLRPSESHPAGVGEPWRQGRWLKSHPYPTPDSDGSFAPSSENRTSSVPTGTGPGASLSRVRTGRGPD